jgi:gas vesicle protein
MMKKWLVYVLMGVFAAGISVAEDKAPWWKLGLGGNDDEQMEEPAPHPSHGDRKMMHEGRSDMRQRRPKMSDEQRAKIKAEFEAIHSLAEAARNETDPVKKAELTDQLRTKLTEGAERMQAEFRKRLEKAEAGVEKMRERLEQGEKDMSKRVEEHLQKLLSGEPMEHKGFKGERPPREDRPPVE